LERRVKGEGWIPFPSQGPTPHHPPSSQPSPMEGMTSCELRGRSPQQSGDSGSLAVTKEVAFALFSTAGVRCFSSAGGSKRRRPHQSHHPPKDKPPYLPARRHRGGHKPHHLENRAPPFSKPKFGPQGPPPLLLSLARCIAIPILARSRRRKDGI